MVVHCSSRYEKTLPNRDLYDDEWDYIEPHMPLTAKAGVLSKQQE
jgi:hypothetical protein